MRYTATRVCWKFQRYLKSLLIYRLINWLFKIIYWPFVFHPAINLANPLFPPSACVMIAGAYRTRCCAWMWCMSVPHIFFSCGFGRRLKSHKQAPVKSQGLCKKVPLERQQLHLLSCSSGLEIKSDCLELSKCEKCDISGPTNSE